MSRTRDPLRIGRYAQLTSGKASHYLRSWRLHRNLTLAEVAKCLGTAPSSISKYELGEIQYTQRALEALAELYQTTPAELLAGPPDGAARPVTDLRELPAETQNELLLALQNILEKSAKKLPEKL